MNFVGFTSKLAVAATVALLLAACGAEQACAQLGQGDVVVGKSQGTTSFGTEKTFFVYDSSASSLSNGPGWQIGGVEVEFIQSVEFDNSNGSHNANGNLLGANFGNSFTGFEIYNFATDGSTAAESVWSIVEATGGTKGTDPAGAWISERGGGLSVSPDNAHIAWINTDSAQIFVHDYSAGGTAGTGAGASMSGPRATAKGNGSGGSGSFDAVNTASQGTAWLSNTTVAAFNSFGEIVTWDISGVAAGSEDGTMAGWSPTEASNWIIANADVAIDAQFTDLEYNATIDPNHIYASATLNGSFAAMLYAYDYNPGTGAISFNKSITVPNDATYGEYQEPRELALGADGGLYFSCYAGSGSDNIVSVLPNATNVAAWNGSNVAPLFRSTEYTGYNGMDVAVSESVTVLYGDYNDDGTIDAADYTTWRDVVTAGGSTLTNDPTPGTVDESDFDYWKAHYGESAGSGALVGAPVPEPSTLLLAALAACAMAMGMGRGSRGAA